MARLFTAASSQYLEIDAAPVTAVPFTMACWFRSASITAAQVLMFIGDKDTGLSFWSLEIRGDVAGDPVRALAISGTQNVAATSSGYSANTWHHGCAVFAGAAERHAYIDGGSKGSDTNSRTPTGADRYSVGRAGDSTPSLYMDGRIAEPAIWNVALTDAEVAALARGVSPLRIRPESLVAYHPVWGLGSPEPDLSPVIAAPTRYDLAVTGAVLANHAPVVPFSRRLWVPYPEAAAALGGGNRRRRVLLGVSG